MSTVDQTSLNMFSSTSSSMIFDSNLVTVPSLAITYQLLFPPVQSSQITYLSFAGYMIGQYMEYFDSLCISQYCFLKDEIHVITQPEFENFNLRNEIE